MPDSTWESSGSASATPAAFGGRLWKRPAGWEITGFPEGQSFPCEVFSPTGWAAAVHTPIPEDGVRVASDSRGALEATANTPPPSLPQNGKLGE
jgi:hypothetical protein